jgi:hypothetical protein
VVLTPVPLFVGPHSLSRSPFVVLTSCPPLPS